MTESKSAATHQMHEAGSSATLTLFREGGYRCQFTFRMPYDSDSGFSEYVGLRLQELAAAGWQPTEPGLEPGEQTEDVRPGERFSGPFFVSGYPDTTKPLRWPLAPTHGTCLVSQI